MGFRGGWLRGLGAAVPEMCTLGGRGALRSLTQQFPEPHFTQDSLGPYIMIQRSVLQEDIAVLNVHVPNN